MKAKIEYYLAATARLFFRNAWKTLFLVLALSVFTVSQLPKLTIDMSTEALLHENDPYRQGYDQFRSEFGQDRIILLTITAPDLFNERFFLKLRALTREIEAQVPYVKKVHSLITVRDIWGDDSRLHVDELLENLTVEPLDPVALEQKVLNNPYYLNHLISEDGRTTAIVIETEAVIYDTVADIDAASILNPEAFEPDTKPATQSHYIKSAENHAVVEGVHSVISSFQTPDFKISFSGTPVVVDIYNQITLTDMIKCSALLLAVVISFLYYLFRRLSGVLLPLIVVVISFLSAMGMMAFAQIPIKIMSTVLPAFILSVGIADAVHILTHFYLFLQQGYDKEDAIALSVGHSGVAVLLTSLTTSAGLLSFSFAEMAAISEMGIFAAIGVVFALFYTLVMMPAIISLVSIKPKRDNELQGRLIDSMLVHFWRTATSKPRVVIVVSVLLLVVSGAFLFKLRFSDHVLNYFPDHMQVKQDALFIQDKLNGLLAFEIIVDTGVKNGLYEPEVLNRIEAVVHQLKQIKDPESEFYVGNVISINDLVKEINQALNNNDPHFYTIAQDRATLAQELFLFELSGADDLKAITDSNFSKTRISVKVPWMESADCTRMVAQIDRILKEIFKNDYRFSLTGMSVILARTYPATLNSMYRSYIIAFVVISLMLIVLVGDFRIGLASILPNILPIMVVMGFLAAFDISLDMTSMMIGSIAMGLVVDDSLHFIYTYRRFWKQSKNPADAIKQTLETTGRALLVTSVVLACGFFSLLSATLLCLVQFGLLLGITILLALLADFLFLPALLLLCTGKPQCPEAVSKPLPRSIRRVDRRAKPAAVGTLLDPPEQ
jgi:predicted RND superfamily exporter protein